MKKEEKQDEEKESEKGKYKSMTDEEIKKLAEDMYKGLIFTDGHVDRREEIAMVFMPLSLMGKDDIENLTKNSPGMIYEYIDKAGPMAINGMPIFLSFRMVNMEDTKKVIDCYNKIIKAVSDV